MRARATPIVIAMQPTRFPNEQTKILYAGFHPEGHRISSGSSLLWSLKTSAKLHPDLRHILYGDMQDHW